jgi:hypothetical protein
MGFLRGLLESVLDNALAVIYTATATLTQSNTNG